jgi:predicted TIM-barrel fold metal-dependent hydrolase
MPYTPPLSVSSRRHAALLLGLGVALMLAALWLTPERVGRAELTAAVVRFEVALLVLGAILLGVGLVRLIQAGKAVAIVLACGCFLLGFYRVYFARAYPRNLLAQPARLAEAWHVLTGQDLALGAYDPRPMLTLESHEPLRAKFPAVNVHAHFAKLPVTPAELFAITDSVGVTKVVNLDGKENDIQQLRADFKGRMVVFRHVWFPVGKIRDSYFDSTVARIERAVPAGARGLKIWKNLGLHTRDSSGKLVHIDDPRMDAVYAKAGELHVPVMMHVGDALAFFQPLDGHNERYEQLRGGFAWSIEGQQIADSDAPSQQELVAQFGRAVGKHPGTTFIGAHILFMGDDLAALGRLLDEHPNLYVEFCAEVPELGREPYTARAFFIKYQDRIMFGTDGPGHKYVGTRNYRAYFRFLETYDEYFDYPFHELTDGGRWKIYGLGLPDSVLRKVYSANAEKVIDLR